MICIEPTSNLSATVSVPGSKYIANRVLVLAALSKGTSTITNVPINEDITALCSALEKLGVTVTTQDNTVTIASAGLSPSSSTIDVNESGTLLRFITGCAALVNGEVAITGSDRIQKRPITELLASLSDLGVESTSTNGCAPLTIRGGTFRGGTTTLPGHVSSQFLSSLLMIAPFAKEDVHITLSTPLVSKKYVDLTIQLMTEYGVNVKRDNYHSFTVKSGQQYTSRDFSIPADWSSANYFFAAAALTQGTVTVNNTSTQYDYGESFFLTCLERMGCEVAIQESNVTVTGKQLQAITVDMSDAPDAVQTLAAVASIARGTTTISNISHLVHKESDRINDTVKEFSKLGIIISSTTDSLIIESSTPHAATINPRSDHRLAMSSALLGLITSGVCIDHHHVVNKSFPEFWNTLKEVGVTANEQ